MNAQRSIRLVLALAALLAGCDSGKTTAPPPTPVSGENGKGPVESKASSGGDAGSRVDFRDQAEKLGVTFQHTDGSSGKYYIVETLASGVGLFDYNGDGRLDIYFPNGGPLPPGAKPREARHALFEQTADGRFVDVTEKAGVSGTNFGIGCNVGDYDLDGDLDLYVTQFGPNVLYRNNGDGTFTDATATAGVGDARFGAGGAFFDYDGDGNLDLYVSNYCGVEFEKVVPCTNNNVPGYCAPSQYPAALDVLYRNNGDGTFADVSEASGIRKPTPGRGMGVVTTDLDGDGKPDIFVANDGSENFLFRNKGDGTFEEIGLEAGVAFDINGDEQGSMGVDVGDIDGDGRLDIVVTNYQKQTNALYRRNDDGYYNDASLQSGIAADALPLVSWGTGFFDADNDGALDIFIASGHLEDQIHRYDQSTTYKQRNQLFVGAGDGTFKDHSKLAGSGLLQVDTTRGAAFGDLDNDGDIDIVLCNSRGTASVLINTAKAAGNWFGLELVGKRDRFAIGARATLHTGTRKQIREVRSGASYVSQNDLRVHFGIGAATSAGVEILWPGGALEKIESVPIGRYSRVVQGRGVVEAGK